MDPNAPILHNLRIPRPHAHHEASRLKCLQRKGRQAQVCLHQILSHCVQIHIDPPGDDRLEDSGDHECGLSGNRLVSSYF